MLEASLNPLTTKPLVIKSRWRLVIEPTGTITDNLQDAPFLIKSINLPFDTISVEKHPSQEKFPSGYSFPETISIEIFEDKNFNTLQYFENWIDAIYDKTTKKFRSGINYLNRGIRQGTLSFYDDQTTMGNPLTSLVGRSDLNILKSFTFHNMKCLGISEISLAKGDDTFLTYSVQFSIDAVTTS